MRKNIVLLAVVLEIFLASSICNADSIFTGADEPNGLHGEAWAAINKSVDHEWGIDLYYRFNNYLAVGVTEITWTENDGMFYPNQQLYDTYIILNPFKNTEIKLGHWCNHPVVWKKTQQNEGTLEETDYIKFRYKW